MKVFLSHSKELENFDNLYNSIINYFKGTPHLFILPETLKVNTKEIIKNCDVFMCEISHLSFGVGIETGWADAFDKPIFCFYKKGVKTSSAFSYLTDKMFCYEQPEDLIKIMDEILIKLSETQN